ncbi:hypothetical protein NKH93_28300 [Mesorhizobium sp. M0954]|uniref:hypothetical protein n=1 Tax=unclassified Mesorhizobium TaxID=325217 RepID=UPI0033362F20
MTRSAMRLPTVAMIATKDGVGNFALSIRIVLLGPFGDKESIGEKPKTLAIGGRYTV